MQLFPIFLIIFLLLLALVMRLIHMSVSAELKDLERAVEDSTYRESELRRLDALLESHSDFINNSPPIPPPPRGRTRFLLSFAVSLGVMLPWIGIISSSDPHPLLMPLAAAGMMILVIGVWRGRMRSRGETVLALIRRRAELKRMNNDWTGAAADARRQMRLAPWDDSGWAELAEDCLATGSPTEALAAAQKAVLLDPGYDDYRYLVASSSLQSGNLAECADILDTWPEGEKDLRFSLFRAALALARHDREKAQTELRKALDQDRSGALAAIGADAALSELAPMAE